MEEVYIDDPHQVVSVDIGQSDDSAKSGRLSEDFGVEEESAVPVEQIFQNMRQREMEILLRSGFPETNGQAEMAVDKFEQNGEGKEKKEKEDIMILDEENKQNSAAALSSELNLSGDDKTQSQSVLQVEEKLQKLGQKDILTSSKQLLENNYIPPISPEELYQKIRQREMETSVYGGLPRVGFPGAGSSSTLLMSMSETQSEPDKMTVEEFFQSIRQHDVNILVRSGYPGASYHQLDSEDSAYEIVHEELRNNELSIREENAHIQDVIEKGIIQEESVESFTGVMLCLPCCYTKRSKPLYVKKMREEKKEKRPGLLKRFRQFVSRIVRRRRE
ncbi:uncharacterized protein [Magallana gigas]|uniref:uncharacterized protein isoform X1 n=1 Tax=Magallana gigas TaxID=29159 RepID=UPI00333F1D03